MKKLVALNDFPGFRVNHEVSFDILQFVEDTIILGDYSWSNLWSIKAILRGFEPFSSLHINFYKSNIFGVNVDNNFIQRASSFLHCCIGNLPIKFWGVQVWSSPRRVGMQMEIINMMRNKLSF